MDIKGAKILTERLAERQWLAAQSVQRGDQPNVDPDADYLESIGDDYRYAFSEDGESTPRRVKKVLVEGSWRFQDGNDREAHAAA
jgi:hypothetical protein